MDLAGALGAVLTVLLIAAPTASADTGVVGVSPKAARPGEQVTLTVGCGGCAADARFPVSLVPVANAPRPHSCHGNAVCIPSAGHPPKNDPFVFLGSTSGGTAFLPGADPPGLKADLRFTVPAAQPGRYAFVLFAALRGGPKGGYLIADTRPGQILRILPTAASSDSGDDGDDAIWWIVGGIAAIGLALAAVLLLRRRRAT
jgi:hypothetical protein